MRSSTHLHCLQHNSTSNELKCLQKEDFCPFPTYLKARLCLVWIEAFSVVAGDRRRLMGGVGVGRLRCSSTSASRSLSSDCLPRSEDSPPESNERLMVILACMAVTTDSVARNSDAVSGAQSSSRQDWIPPAERVRACRRGRGATGELLPARCTGDVVWAVT